MNKWRALIVVASAAAALAVGLGAQAGPAAGDSLQSLWHATQLG
ncbi:hypothetical protein [Phenylobacterium sp.]|jgi:anti-sigma-K factor RskA